MSRLLWKTCSRYQLTMIDSIPECLNVKHMHPKVSLVLFFVASLSLALIINILPNIMSLLAYTGQLTTTFSFSGHSNTGFSLAKNLQPVYNNDLCSRTFVRMDSLLLAARNDVSTQSMTVTDSDRLARFDRSGKCQPHICVLSS